MAVPMLIIAKWRQISVKKTIIVAVLLTITGTVGAYLLYFLENGILGGISFFGAIFLVPVVFALFTLPFKLSYGQIMDLCAPAECIMLAIMKIQCLIHGCCAGRVLFVTTQGQEIIFPSQIVEFINALIICYFLMQDARNKERYNTLFPRYMVIYGITRFFLNLLRAETEAFLFGLPVGNIWSFITVLIGFAWLLCGKRKLIGFSNDLQ